MLRQTQMFERSHAHVTEVYKTFLHIVSTGLTREELALLIAMRPSLWARFEPWLNRLPSSQGGN